MIAMAELRISDLSAGYVPGHPILRGINLTAKPGRVTVVLGPNGAGKSTMLKVTVAGYLSPKAGPFHWGPPTSHTCPRSATSSKALLSCLRDARHFPILPLPIISNSAAGRCGGTSRGCDTPWKASSCAIRHWCPFATGRPAASAAVSSVR